MGPGTKKDGSADQGGTSRPYSTHTGMEMWKSKIHNAPETNITSEITIPFPKSLNQTLSISEWTLAMRSCASAEVNVAWKGPLVMNESYSARHFWRHCLA